MSLGRERHLSLITVQSDFVAKKTFGKPLICILLVPHDENFGWLASGRQYLKTTKFYTKKLVWSNLSSESLTFDHSPAGQNRANDSSPLPR